MGKAMGAGACWTQRSTMSKHHAEHCDPAAEPQAMPSVQVGMGTSEQNRLAIVPACSRRQDPQAHLCREPERVRCSVPTSHSADDLISCVTAEPAQRLHPLCTGRETKP